MITFQTRSKGEGVLKFADEEDLQQIYDFALIVSKDDEIPDLFQNMGEELISLIESRKHKPVICYVGDELIGVLAYVDRGSYLRLNCLYVRLDYRREGVATKLVKSLDHFISPKKTLRVVAVTEGGRKFWESCGYKITGWEMEK